MIVEGGVLRTVHTYHQTEIIYIVGKASRLIFFFLMVIQTIYSVLFEYKTLS